MVKQVDRYAVSIEEEFEPGSHHRVLKNLLNIKSKRGIDIAESAAYDKVVDEAINFFGKTHQFTANDCSRLHHMWLRDIYAWAGEFRNVNVSKNDFQFAGAHLVPKLMREFEKEILHQYTPCCFLSVDDIAKAIAVVHTEFILIHPFREGNGRLGRLISVLMGLQANLPILNFESIKGKKKQEYILAVHAGVNRNYEPMQRIFRLVIDKTLKLYGE